MDTADRARLARALEFALEAHADQRRKGTEIPYVSHLLQVAGLVLEHGGDAEQASAALLHDTLEDCEGVTEARLASAFGAGVAGIVRDCTDTEPDESPAAKRPWQERKTAHLAQLAASSARSALVAACDKRHNLATLVAGVRRHGPAYLDRFRAPGPDQVWYFEEAVRALGGRIPEPLALELRSLAAELRALLAPGPVDSRTGVAPPRAPEESNS